MTRELTSQHDTMVLDAELRRAQPVVYSVNGNRSSDDKAFLKRIEQIAPRAGITRVADISDLSPTSFPVYQSCRPNLYLSAAYGQNTGAQGKGALSTQARISCLMEAIESYCVEPRTPNLLRGTYDYLHQHHLIVDPRCFVQRTAKPLGTDEPLMWTPVYSTRLRRPVLVPAEAVYFPFIPSYFGTRSAFIAGSNGLASGASYLEATLHALYELIERYYIHRMETGDLTIEALFECEIDDPRLQATLDPSHCDGVVQLYCLRLPGAGNLPMVRCCFITGDTFYSGWGCSSTVDISIARAVSEAFQCRATHISGSREDMKPHTTGVSTAGAQDDDIFGRCEQPSERTMHLCDLRKQVHDRQFLCLRDEYDFVLGWLEERGFGNVLIANLSRHGIDLPVVKAIIPHMELPAEFKVPPRDDVHERSPYHLQYGAPLPSWEAAA